MASSFHSNLNFLQLPNPTPSSSTTLKRHRHHTPIRCGGPRSNRGPLIKGRILSTEAIHTIQALKRVHRTNPTSLDSHVSKTLSRLIKADLIATFKELLRQEQYEIALKVFSAVRSEYRPELNLYADLVNALASKGLTEEIDQLVCDMEKDGEIQGDDKGLIRLVKGLVEAERKESTVRIYGLLKKSGWGSSFEVDEYVAGVLSKGLRRMGVEALADEIDKELNRLSRGIFAKTLV